MTSNRFQKYLLITSLAIITGIYCHNSSANSTTSSMASPDTILSYSVSQKPRPKKGTGTEYKPLTSEQADSLLLEASKYTNNQIEDLMLFNNSTLTDIGTEEKPDRVRLSEETLDKCIRSANMEDTLIISHNHPIEDSRIIPPNPDDFKVLFYIQTGCYWYYNKNITIVGKVYDGKVMWTWTLEDYVLNNIKAGGKRERKQMKLINSIARKSYSDIYNKETEHGHEDDKMWSSPESIEQYISDLSKVGLKLTVTRLEKTMEPIINSTAMKPE